MRNHTENEIAEEIKKEYKRIDKRWLELHYHVFLISVMISTLFEIIAAVLYFVFGDMEISLSRYVIKYIGIPLMINLIFVLIGIRAMNSSKLKQKNKMYFVSLIFVGVCFVFFTVHIIFDSLYFLFFAPIILTMVYNSYMLTSVTSVAAIILKILSELFIVWDPDKTYPFESSLDTYDFVFSTLILLSFFIFTLVVIRFEKKKTNARIKKEVEHYKTQLKLAEDDLTGLYNRKALRDAFQDMIDDDIAENEYVFTMMDLDGFKKINDIHGHLNGDRFLREIGEILKSNTPNEGKAFRFGGDEFCILFKNVVLAEIQDICKSIQEDLENGTINTELGTQITVSIGIAKYEEGLSPKQLLRNTDMALYHSKRTKNKTTVFDPDII